MEDRVRRHHDAAGRRPESLSVSVFAFEGVNADALRRYRDLGVERVTVVSPRRLSDALPFLDRTATLIPDLA